MTVQGSKGYELTWDDIVQRLQVTADVPLIKDITSGGNTISFRSAVLQEILNYTFAVVNDTWAPGVYKAYLYVDRSGSPVTILNVYLE